MQGFRRFAPGAAGRPSFSKLALEPMPEDNRRVLAVLRYLNA